MRASTKRSVTAAAAVAMISLTVGCSGGDDGGKAADAAPRPGSSPAQSEASGSATRKDDPGLEGDVKINSCAAGKGGLINVSARVTNSRKTPQNYIVSVEIQQDGKKVDGVALMGAAVKAGATVTAEQSGSKVIKGAVTCKVVQVQTMGA